jgi:O-antigen biosynthesis protein WbqP
MSKQIFDRLIAVISSTIFVPIILILIVAIRLTSSGPGIFRQQRVGQNGKLFTCYKLRTMYADTQDRPSHLTARSAITPLGSVLRRTKLDELPQLWNIALGDMSFVGPRPCLPSQHELIRLRTERGLYGLRPGITGVAQVNGVDMSDPIALVNIETQYLNTMGLVEDLRLILLTIIGTGSGDAAKR